MIKKKTRSKIKRPVGINRLTLAATLVGASVLGSVVFMTFAAGGPAGNNGTVKIDGQPFDDAPNNEPHVACSFQVDFYGYDKGNLFADVDFQQEEPTGGSTMTVTGSKHVFIGGDDNSGGGSTAGLDASQRYYLHFNGAPQSQQGYHVKLTVHANGSQGADVKHKEFWVQPCPAD